MGTTPIAEHAFLSDRHPRSLVDRARSANWSCSPRSSGPDQVERAAEVFERAASHPTELGLLPEEVDAGSGEPRGDSSQAFRSVGPVSAAGAVYQADTARAR